MEAAAHIRVGQRRHTGSGGELEQALECGERAKADVALQEVGAHPEIVGDHHRDDHRAGSRSDVRRGELAFMDVGMAG